MLCIILVSRCVPGCSQMILKFCHWILIHTGMILCKFTVVTIFNIDRERHELLCERRVLELWFSLFYHHLRVWVRWNTQNHPINARETHKIRNGLNRWMDFLLNARFDFSFWRFGQVENWVQPIFIFFPLEASYLASLARRNRYGKHPGRHWNSLNQPTVLIG